MPAKRKKYPVTYRRKSQVNSYTGDTPAPTHSIVVSATSELQAYAITASVSGRQDIKVGQPKVRRAKKAAAITVAPENPNNERRETTYFPPQPCPTVRCCEGDDDGDGNCVIHSAPGVLRADSPADRLRNSAGIYRNAGLHRTADSLFDRTRGLPPLDVDFSPSQGALKPQTPEEAQAYEEEHSVPEVVKTLDAEVSREYYPSMTDEEAEIVFDALLDPPPAYEPAKPATKAILCTALLVFAAFLADSTFHLHKLSNTQGSVALLYVGISFIIAALPNKR